MKDLTYPQRLHLLPLNQLLISQSFLILNGSSLSTHRHCKPLFGTLCRISRVSRVAEDIINFMRDFFAGNNKDNNFLAIS